jgi:hypothetical protein
VLYGFHYRYRAVLLHLHDTGFPLTFGQCRPTLRPNRLSTLLLVPLHAPVLPPTREQGRPAREQQTDAISHNEKASAAGKRRQVRARAPHDRQDTRLRLGKR